MPRSNTKLYRAQVAQAVPAIKAVLESGLRVTVLIHDPSQARMLRGQVSTEATLRIAMASEVGPRSMARFESDSEIIRLEKTA